MKNPPIESHDTFSSKIRNLISPIKTHAQLLSRYGMFPKTNNHFKIIFKKIDELDKLCDCPELNRKPRRK